MSILQRMKKKIDDTKAQFSGGFDNAFYNYFDLPFNEVIQIRFVPYLDPLYDQFWTKRVMVPMEFTNPADEKNPIRVQAPCLEMYGPEHEYQGMNKPAGCPLLRMVRPIYKEAEALATAGKNGDAALLKEVANKHWTGKTTQIWYQGFINSSPIKEKNPAPENLLRIISATKDIHKKIYESIFENKSDPFTSLPMGEFTIDDVREVLAGNVDDDRAEVLIKSFEGYNFNLKLVEKGINPDTKKPFRDWTSATTWSRSTSSLTDEQLDSLNKNGFHDLRAKLPVQPTEQKYDRYMEMMELSIARAKGEVDAVWNPDWEKPFDDGEAGCTPMRARRAAGEGEGEPAKTTVSVSKPAGSASVVAQKLQQRGKKAESAPAPAPEPVETPAEEPVKETAAKEEAPVSTPAETKTEAPTGMKSSSRDLLNRIRNRSAS